MYRRFVLYRPRIALALVGLAAAGAAAAFVVPALGSPVAAATTVTVVGTDSKVSISKKTFAVGAVTFKIANKGRLTHVFVAAGKRTAVKAHRTAVVKITFTSAGRFTWTWTGKKTLTGQLVVTRPGGGTTTATTTTGTTATGPSTTITVNMTEYRFDMSQTTVPAGNVTFVIKNVGKEVHNFDVVSTKMGKFLDPGQSETWTVNLGPRNYTYICDVPYHAGAGLEGTLTVTP
jgi:uncharacterized cupredoxin-like copper-binding protein